MAKPCTVSRGGQDEHGGFAWNGFISCIGLGELESMSPIQRPAHLAYWYMSEVCNGGHFQYFVNKEHYDHWEVVEALKHIGAERCSEILVEAIAHFAASAVERPNSLEEYVESESEARMGDLDRRYFDIGDPEMRACLEWYLQQHEPEFITWVP